MIKSFIYILIALGIGAWLYQLLGDDPGYVLVTFGDWSVETTLVFMVLFLLLLLVLIYGIYRLAGFLNPAGLFRGDGWFGSGRRHKQAAAASEDGLKLLLLGHWQDAYKVLVENADRGDNAVFNYLAASLAAWQRGDDASRNYCLERAARKSRNNNPGIRSLKALLEYRSGKTEQSLAILLALDKEAPGSPYVLSMLKNIYLSLHDWDKLDALLPTLEKYHVVSEAELHQLQEMTATRRLQLVTLDKGGADALERQWRSLEKKVRRGENAMQAYLGKLLEFSRHEEALAELAGFLKHQWSDNLVRLAGFIETNEPGRVLVLLEKWLKSRPNNAALLLSLGRSSMRNLQWGQAREYFENALRQSKSTELSAEANAELARLLDAMGEHAQGAKLYRKAMAQLDHQLPDLPLP